MTETLVLDPELYDVLWAAYEQWKKVPMPPEDRIICWEGIVEFYKARVGKTFHQGKLRSLANLGLLSPAHAVRGGGRRYYKILNPAQVEALLGG